MGQAALQCGPIFPPPINHPRPNKSSFPTAGESAMDRPLPPPSPPSPPSNSMNHPGILIIVLILTIVLLSTGIHILLRFLDRRRLLRFPSSSSSESARPNPAFSGLRVSPEEAPSKAGYGLPAFTFSAVFPGGGKDCAVCLAQFEGDDQLRLLPACAHAFHTACIDAWLATNLTCPLCRASIRLTADDVASLPSSRSGSFRIEIGSVSRRRLPDSAGASSGRRSYSVGSFEYVLDDDLELEPPPLMTTKAGSPVREEGAMEPGLEPPGEGVAETAGGRGWLDRLASSASASSLSSRTMSFRLSGMFASGSRRSSGSWDLEGNWEGHDGNFSNFLRWLAGL